MTDKEKFAGAPLWALAIYATQIVVLEKLEEIMANQDILNQFVADLNTAVGVVAAEIQALQAANPDLDWSGAQAALSALQGLEPPVAQ